MAAKRLRAAPTRLARALFWLETLATPGRPGVRKIAARFGVNFETVQRISRPFVGPSVVAIVP